MTRERFAVSAHGLRQLHAGREPWALVKELRLPSLKTFV